MRVKLRSKDELETVGLLTYHHTPSGAVFCALKDYHELFPVDYLYFFDAHTSLECTSSVAMHSVYSYKLYSVTFPELMLPKGLVESRVLWLPEWALILPAETRKKEKRKVRTLRIMKNTITALFLLAVLLFSSNVFAESAINSKFFNSQEKRIGRTEQKSNGTVEIIDRNERVQARMRPTYDGKGYDVFDRNERRIGRVERQK